MNQQFSCHSLDHAVSRAFTITGNGTPIRAFRISLQLLPFCRSSCWKGMPVIGGLFRISWWYFMVVQQSIVVPWCWCRDGQEDLQRSGAWCVLRMCSDATQCLVFCLMQWQGSRVCTVYFSSLVSLPLLCICYAPWHISMISSQRYNIYRVIHATFSLFVMPDTCISIAEALHLSHSWICGGCVHFCSTMNFVCASHIFPNENQWLVCEFAVHWFGITPFSQVLSCYFWWNFDAILCLLVRSRSKTGHLANFHSVYIWLLSVDYLVNWSSLFLPNVSALNNSERTHQIWRAHFP